MTQPRLKPSRYNHFFQIQEGDDNKYMVYNALSNGLARVESWLYEKVQNNSLTAAELEDPANKALWASLQRGLVLVDADMDELSFIRVKSQIARFNCNTLTLTIVVSHACNLNCSYCYQRHGVGSDPIAEIGEDPGPAGTDQDVVLTEEREDQIVDFVDGLQKVFNYRHLRVTWYGGEPLLFVPTIESLSKELIALCDLAKMSYSASVVTNGTCLTKDVASRLKDLGVDSFQITVDGPREVHDKRRPYKGRPNASSFDTIVANLADVYGIVPISLRINIDKSNSQDCVALLQDFKDRGLLDDSFKLKVQLANTTRACDSFTSREFAYVVQGLSKELDRFGPTIIQVRYPALSKICPAVSLHFYVIEPNGMYHRCWETVGRKEEYLGKITDPITLGKRALDWLQYDATQFRECAECSFLPICGGGCPYLRLWKPEWIAADPDHHCTNWKLLMRERMRDFLAQRSASRRISPRAQLT
jgi:uncharacterized protein